MQAVWLRHYKRRPAWNIMKGSGWMSGKQKSYLENQLEAVAEKTDAGYTFTFQREK